MRNKASIVPPENFRKIEFWSEPVEEVQLTAAGGNVVLPPVTIANLPDMSVALIECVFSARMIENTNALANTINNVSTIELQDPTGNWTVMINAIPTPFCTLAGATREKGFKLSGHVAWPGVVINLQNVAYPIQWAAVSTMLNFINFNEVQTGLIFYYGGRRL